MFKNNNGKSNPSKNGSNGLTMSSSTVNSLGPGTFVEGSISTESDIRIDGEIKGNLNCKGRLILGEHGKITGDVDCQNGLIEGQITGTIKVKELLHVKESAKIDGDITTTQLMVQPGAVFNVSCSMNRIESTPITTPKDRKKEISAETLLKEEEVVL